MCSLNSVLVLKPGDEYQCTHEHREGGDECLAVFLAPALVNDAPKNLRSLDDWIDYFSITIFARHCAVADALGTAQLFLALRARAGSVRTAEQLFALARDQRWLNTRSRR